MSVASGPDKAIDPALFTEPLDAAGAGHWKTTTFTGALRLTGMTAPFVYDVAMNGNVFLAYIEQVLVPTCRRATSS